MLDQRQLLANHLLLATADKIDPPFWEIVDRLVERGVRAVPADAVVVTEEALALALRTVFGWYDEEYEEHAAAILAELREWEGER